MSTFNVEKYVPTINVLLFPPPSFFPRLELILTFNKQTILRISDLSTISAKRIRRALAQEFPNDEIAQNKVRNLMSRYPIVLIIKKSIVDQRILDCFRTIRDELEGSASNDDDHQQQSRRATQDLLKSDLIHPSSPVASVPSPKRKLLTSPPPPTPKKKPRPTSCPVVKRDHNESDEDAKFAAELDLALNSTPVRRTRGAVAGTRIKPRSKRKGKTEEEGDVPKKKRAPNPNSAFHAPMLLSTQLSEVILETELLRPVFTATSSLLTDRRL